MTGGQDFKAAKAVNIWIIDFCGLGWNFTNIGKNNKIWYFLLTFIKLDNLMFKLDYYIISI